MSSNNFAFVLATSVHMSLFKEASIHTIHDVYQLTWTQARRSAETVYEIATCTRLIATRVSSRMTL